ncbi:hypothetical protein LNTAR_10106, partial [Lentisphaera araneosa HTCC2155]
RTKGDIRTSKKPRLFKEQRQTQGKDQQTIEN